MPEPTVSVVVLGLECGLDANVVAARLGADVTVDDASGIRVVGAETARAFLAELTAARQREREQRAQRLASVGAAGDGIRARVRRLQRAQERLELIDSAGEHLAAGQALEAMKVLAGDRDRRLDAAAAQRNELLGGVAVYHSVNESQE